ncbi:protein TALPID3 [Aplochiton taeniatus]
MPAQESAGLNALEPGPLPLPRPTPALLQRTALAPSMFEDAERVLQQVKRNRRVLEENLDAMLRANDGEVLHSQLEALSNNRDATEEVRIKKTVDAWINALSKDIQDEVAKEEFGLQRNTKAKDSESKVALNKEVSVLLQQKAGSSRDNNLPSDLKRQAGSRLRPAGSQVLVRGYVGQTDRHRGQIKDQQTRPGGKLRPRLLQAQPGDQLPEEVTEAVGEGEAYLMRLYGKALYEGHRRTLKKGPYLRFSSPSPKTKSPRPRVVESVRGVKVKSSKTQTSLAPDPSQHASSPVYPPPREPQYLFSPSRVTPGDPSHPHTTPLEGFLIPMAIPLGQPRVDGVAPQPSRVLISDHPVVATTSTPITLPRSTPAPTKPNAAILEVQSDQGYKRRVSSQLQVQVQPGVNILPPTPGPVSSPPPAVPPSHIQTMEETTEWMIEADEEEGDNIFPGRAFLAVADVCQEPEEESVTSEVAIELDGLASPPAALYHGPVFPPQAASPAQEHDPILGSIRHRETLENRLVDWVEQQLMARFISEMYHPPVADPAQNDSNVQSETEENSVTSDIVLGAGGGGGLQLFVEANVPVDSALIRQYVNEALAEAVALMLGQRESEGTATAPAPAKTQEPPPTPLESTDVEPPGQGNLPWGDAELPLAEEEPHNHSQEIHLQTHDSRPIVMSVAEEEPVFVSPHTPAPAQPLSQPRHSPTPPPAPLPGPESVVSSPCTSTEDDSSTSNSNSTSTSTSSACTGTDQVMKHISEGELLISYNKLAAMGAYEEGFCLPHGINSFSSSLHEVQDMDYDPPSEGQVRRPQMGGHHDPILSLLAKMDLGVNAGLRPQPEGSWEEEGEGEESLGEVSEGQRPRLTPAEERVLTGQSLLDPGSRTTNSQRTSRTRTKAPKRRTEEVRTTEASNRQVSSPGQFSQSAEVTERSLGETGQGPVTLRDLDVHAARPAMTSHPQTPSPGMSPLLQNYSPTAEQVGALRAAPILVQQYLSREEGPHHTVWKYLDYTGNYISQVTICQGGPSRGVVWA